jgi:hypothetical protein
VGYLRTATIIIVSILLGLVISAATIDQTAMTVPTSSLKYYENINFNLVHNDPMQDVNDALKALAAALLHWHESEPRPMSVCPYAVVYDSVYQRDFRWDLYLRNNPVIGTEYSAEEWNEEKKAYGIIGDAVHDAVQRYSMFYMVSMQNPVFSHSWHMRYWDGEDTPELREKFYTGDVEWHEFVLLLNQREVRDDFYPTLLVFTKGLTAAPQVYIYDLSYVFEEPPTPRLRRDLKMLPLIGPKAYKMIKEIKCRKLRVDKVFVGGGGNENEDCRKMSLWWMRQCVEQMLTTKRCDLPVKWEIVNFA